MSHFPLLQAYALFSVFYFTLLCSLRLKHNFYFLIFIIFFLSFTWGHLRYAGHQLALHIGQICFSAQTASNQTARVTVLPQINSSLIWPKIECLWKVDIQLLGLTNATFPNVVSWTRCSNKLKTLGQVFALVYSIEKTSERRLCPPNWKKFSFSSLLENIEKFCFVFKQI